MNVRSGQFDQLCRISENMIAEFDSNISFLDFAYERAKAANNEEIAKAIYTAKRHLINAKKKLEPIPELAFQEWNKLWEAEGRPV